jgi:hypothetical protein
MLRLRKQRERRAQAELEHCAARQTAADTAAESAASALAAQMLLRSRHEAQIYREMLGRTLTPRDIEGVIARLSTLGAQVVQASVDADVARRAAAAARDAVDDARLAFGKRFLARRKWQDLVARAEQSAQRRAAIVEELTAADFRLGRTAP